MNRISSFAFIIFILLVSLTARAEGEILGIKGECHTSIGIYIKDLLGDSVVFETGADRCYVPASILKSYTAASAMSLLDRDFRFSTKVYLTGSGDGDGNWNGDIVVKASGDPTLESEQFKDNAGFIPKIINALTSKGVKKINGDVLLERVVADRQYPEGPNQTWSINDVPRAYGCGAFDFNWCDNYFSLYPATGRMTSPVPDLDYTVWSRPWDNNSDVYRGIYSDSLIIVGSGYNTAKAKLTTSMPYPFDVFRERLLTRLNNEGVTVTGKRNGSESRTLIVTQRSPRLDDILKSLMVRSDNMYAEAILRVLGSKYGSLGTSIAAENKLWRDRGLEPGFNRILDGSGLSRTNAVSPRFMGDMLEWMAKSSLASRYIDLFPVSGKSGTMRSFHDDTRLKGRLAMKTGSVNAVQSYAGYMTDENNNPTHVIVIMVNNFYCSRQELKTALRNFMLEILP